MRNKKKRKKRERATLELFIRLKQEIPIYTTAKSGVLNTALI